MAFFQNHVQPLISKYQVESQCSSKKSANFSRETFENILLEAINEEKVCFTMITILIHNFFVVGQVFS